MATTERLRVEMGLLEPREKLQIAAELLADAAQVQQSEILRSMVEELRWYIWNQRKVGQ